MKEGDRVIIQDHSEAHGDHGTVWAIQPDGTVIVEIDPDGVLWPVDESELKPE